MELPSPRHCYFKGKKEYYFFQLLNKQTNITCFKFQNQQIKQGRNFTGIVYQTLSTKKVVKIGKNIFPER